MQHDEVIWQVVNHSFCSFKATIDDKARVKQNFCRNEHNVTGLCNRSSCPLANSRYATIREHDGRIFLYVKTIERAHSPKNLWEKIKLPKNYTKALEIVSQQLEFFPKFLVHKNKQRLTKIHQYLIRMRRLQLRVKPKLVRINKKVERRDKRREEKALSAAKIEKSIESELLERLKRGTYGSIYNFPEKQYESALDSAEAERAAAQPAAEGAEEEEEDFEGEYEDEEEAEVEYVEDLEESDESDLEDYEVWDESSSGAGAKRKMGSGGRASKRSRGGDEGGPRVELEYEQEEELEEEEAAAAAVW